MNILIAGGAGYVGSQLIQNLLYFNMGDLDGEIDNIDVIDNLIYNNWYSLTEMHYLYSDRLKFFNLDINSEHFQSFDLSKYDTIFWLPALVGAPICDKYPQLAKETNLESVRKLIPRLTGQKLVFLNTNSGYGIAGEDYCTEESPLNPISLYGITKCEAEKAVLKYENGLSLRLATVFGLSPRPRLDLMVNDWTYQLTKYGQISIFEGHFKRNFVHIDDVCRAMIHLVKENYIGIFNVGLDSANTTKLGLAHKICDVIGLDRSCVTEGVGEDPDKRNYNVSSKKLENTNFEFQYSLEDGIKAIHDFTKRIGNLPKDNFINKR